MRVRFTDEAKAKLSSIHRFIADDSPGNAIAIVDRLIRRAEGIGQAPHAGREVPEYRQAELREILVRPYRIIYRVRPGTVEILTIMHYRQLLPGDLGQPR